MLRRIRQRYIQLNLTAKLVLLVVLSAVLPLSIMGTATYWLMEDQLETRLNERLVQVAEQSAEQLDEFLTARSREIAGIAQEPELVGGGASTRLQRYREWHPHFNWLGVLDSDGAVVGEDGELQVPDDAEGADGLRQAWAEAAEANERIVVDVSRGGPDAVRYLTFIEPVTGSAPYVVGQMPLSALTAVHEGITIGETGRVTLFDGEGVLIGHEDRSRIGYDMSHYPIMRPPVEDGEGHPGGQFLSGDGDEKWGLTVMLPEFQSRYGQNWGIIVDQTLDELHAPVHNLWWLLWAVWVIAFAVTLVAGYRQATVLSRPIRHLVERLLDISHGAADLTRRLDAETRDEVGQTAEGFNRVMERLQGLLQEIKQVGHKLGEATTSMSESTERATRAMQTQQSEMDQVATAMNEMASTVQEVARNSQFASDAARRGTEEAANGQEVVRHARDANETTAREVQDAAAVISELKEDSDNIGTILQTISGISEQTNLLALNAAIEAARAGSQGRGFSVVAEEVRKLAQRTNDATTEIQEIIEQLQTRADRAANVMERSRTRAEESLERADQARGALETINEAISEINDLNAQIASAAEEQSQVADEINQSITRINDLSSENAQSSEQIRKTAANLDDLSGNLESLLEAFRTR